MDAANAARNSPEHVAELVAEGETGARGELEIEAANGLDYALRLPGPGHVPLIIQPMRIEADGPLRVVVGAGAGASCGSGGRVFSGRLELKGGSCSAWRLALSLAARVSGEWIRTSS